MTIDQARAMQYLYDRFALSGEAQRLCANLFAYIDGHDVPDPTGLLLDVLDAIGFSPDDYSNMARDSILS